MGSPKKGAPVVTRRAKAALPSQIVPLGSGTAQFMRLLLFSEPGEGKTTLIGTSPKALILECDRGEISAVIAGSTAQKWSIDDWSDMEEAMSYLRNGGAKEWDWVWIDSLSVFQDLGLDQIMEDLVAAKPHRQVWGADKGEYGQNMSRISRTCREMRRFPCNVGWTAHVKRVENRLGVEKLMPNIQGQGMPEKICGYADIVAHIELIEKEDKEPYTVLSTRKIGDWYAKDRFKVIGRMARPTIPKIMAAAEAARAGKPTAAKTSTTAKKATAKTRKAAA